MPYTKSRYTVTVEPFRAIIIEADCPLKAAIKASRRMNLPPGEAVQVYSEKFKRWLMYEVGASPRLVTAHGTGPFFNRNL